MIARNDLGIPLHCVDCPYIAPTLDDVRDLETIIEMNLATSPESEAKVAHLMARKMVKMSILLSRTDHCTGLVLDQYIDDDGASINMYRCQAPF